jgi:hypothetical protein
MKATVVFEVEYPASRTADFARAIIRARNVIRRDFQSVRIVKAIDEASKPHDTAKQLAIAVAARGAVEVLPTEETID